jgi:hypothetical protein
MAKKHVSFGQEAIRGKHLWAGWLAWSRLLVDPEMDLFSVQLADTGMEHFRLAQQGKHGLPLKGAKLEGLCPAGLDVVGGAGIGFGPEPTCPLGFPLS